MVKVKICGITNRDDAFAAVEAGADALGFIFAPEARAKGRYISPGEARAIVADLPPFVTAVAVTVNATEHELDTYLKFMDCVQLHGEEPAALAARFGRRAIKALPVDEHFSPARVLEYAVGAVLLDAHVPGQRGGTGKTADWDRAREAAAQGTPIILAGGLTPENVAEAVQAVHPYAVDVCGGVEREPGKKDHERIRRFIENARVSVSG